MKTMKALTKVFHLLLSNEIVFIVFYYFLDGTTVKAA
jgi:hypothetical protein